MAVLIDCPECKREVSDRATSCPQCAYPIAASIAERRVVEQAEADRQSRRTVGEVDCPNCDARGFVTEGQPDRPSAFSWCAYCEHSGRVPLVQSDRGYWAVAFASLDAFLGGAALEPPHVTDLGQAPAGHRYASAGPRAKDDTTS